MAMLSSSVPSTYSVAKAITVCIKHTSRFARRRVMLQQLLQTVRHRYGYGMRVLVADDGGVADETQLWGAELIVLPAAAGLSAGRNALVSATRTPFLAIVDDDVLFHNATSLNVLLAALEKDPAAAIAAGCYIDTRFGSEDCFNLHFDADEGGAVVRARHAHHSHGCEQVHAAHNFFVARTATLRRFRWDPRQKVMEHESFFYQLLLNQQKVLACAGVTVLHNTTRDEQYRERSFRLQEQRFMQFHCKNFPELARFETPYLLWRCDSRSYCSPAWHAQFAYDGRDCKPMVWDTDEDYSALPRPLLSNAIHPAHLFAADGRRASGLPNTTNQPLPHVPLLALVFTEPKNVGRREWQRATWLSYRWHRGSLDHKLVPWRYVFIMARPAAGEATEYPDQIVGDVVTLQNCTESYANLVFKTMEALRWALSHASFEVLLKVDDDSIVHVGRLWSWIFTDMLQVGTAAPAPSRVYAGRVFRGSQVIRSNYTRASLWRPDWFPSSFKKWAVGYDVFSEPAYPPYCGGGGYVLGREAAERIVGQYDAHFGPSRVVHVEDAFVGVLARAQGIVPTDLLTFQEPSRGSLQTREMFIDQVLVHRVIEPYKAFRWLMLSSNCHAGPRVCAYHRNRTRGLSPQGALSTSAGAEESHTSGRVRHDMDWISGAIPKASADARTGEVPSYDASPPPTARSLGGETDPVHKRNKKQRQKQKKRARRKQRPRSE